MELQKEVLLDLLNRGMLSQEIVLTVEALIFIGLGISIHRLYRKYLNQRSYLKETLSERELEIFQEIIHGHPNQEIADRLFIEKSTLKTHINNMYRKLKIQNREELMRYYSDV